MVNDREAIPRKTEAEILFNNDHTCCICREKGKDVQIHHIDENKNNNDIKNLAVLCLNCHSVVTGKRGLGRKYSYLEVKKYKVDWEYTIKKNRGRTYQHAKTTTKLEKKLFKFEIAKKIYELGALRDQDAVKIDEILEFLNLLYLFEEHYTDTIFDNLANITIVSGLGDNLKAVKIAESIPKYFYHLAGPDKVKINKKDTKRLKNAIDLLGNVGEFAAEFNKKYRPVEETIDSLSSLFDLCIWYNQKSIAMKIIKEMSKIKKNCLITFEKNEKKLYIGVRKVNKTLEKFQKDIEKEKRKWPKVIFEINKSKR
ncbi:MAG: HNH endonuclease signature motif containing protein [Candidatus Aenigmarchaeota archaeon]|nr:HNH endonuclease signature motif containing protein [Candidatus Aenigmarchaeota archaeon]